MLFEEETKPKKAPPQEILNFSGNNEISNFHQSIKNSNLHHGILLPNIYKFFLPLLDDLISSISENSMEKFILSPNENGNTLIEDLRECIAFVQKTSFYNKKIIVIHDVCSLSLTVANALLKILEEPPKNTIFLLTFNQQNLILPTIKSRVLCINFTHSENNLEFLYNNFITQSISLQEVKKIIGNNINLLHLFQNEELPIVIEDFTKLCNSFNYNNFKLFFDLHYKKSFFKQLMNLIFENKIVNLTQNNSIKLFKLFSLYKKNLDFYNTNFELFVYYFTKKICNAEK